MRWAHQVTVVAANAEAASVWRQAGWKSVTTLEAQNLVLEREGSQGWELVSATPIWHGQHTATALYLKRRIDI